MALILIFPTLRLSTCPPVWPALPGPGTKSITPLPMLPSPHYYSVQHGSTQTDYANVQQGPSIAEGSKGSSLGQPEVGPDALCWWHLKPGGGDLLELVSTAVICLCWAQILLSAMCGASCFSGTKLISTAFVKKEKERMKFHETNLWIVSKSFNFLPFAPKFFHKKSHFHS